jgi:signal transduction histidine kinase
MSFWTRQSIAVKLPLAFALVLLVLGTAMAIVSYLEVRRTLVDIAATRLEQAASQMATVLGNSARQRAAALQPLMQRPDIGAYLRTRDAAQDEAIVAAVRAYLGTAIAIANVELWDPTGTRLLAAGAPFGELTGDALASHRQELQGRDAIVGRLRPGDDGIYYTVGGRVEQDGAPLGYLVERRRIDNPSQTQQTIDLLTNFIGGDAALLIGNADGSAWSDLQAALTDVPIAATDVNRLLDYQRPGAPPTLAWAMPIAFTPWLVAIEFPRDVVLAPADRLVRRASAIAFTLLVLAAAIGWAFSRRITTPLRQVTDAAEAVAHAGVVAHVAIDRHDEIGRLADAFNTMAERVEQARADLEARVAVRTEELSAVNRELESFSYSVSHDLRAPLRAIAGFVQILEEDHAAAFAPEARRALERVKANATRMGQLIDDLLAFARIGRQPISRQPVDVTHLARTAADEAMAGAAHPIDLVIEPLPPCHGEPALLKQAFANLIANAVKFTARAERAAITIGAQTDGETVYFVRDNGAGFDERFAEKLFGVFQRLHRTAEFEGTGVGLAIVQRIITRHGGRVWAVGRLNEGATFYFTLPAA